MRVVLLATPAEHAPRLARSLVEEGLAACVHVPAVGTSTYRWKGEVAVDEEVLMVLKCAADRVDALRDRALALHPYELPAFVVLAVDESATPASVLDWVAKG